MSRLESSASARPAQSRAPAVRAHRRGGHLRLRYLALWASAVLAVAASFIVHLALRFETVRLGYEVGAARREQRELLESRRLLSLEAATLTQPDRIETVARGAFGMDVPGPARIVPMGKREPARVLSGRMR